MGKLVAICISKKKGTQKKDIRECMLIENYGLEGDAHAGPWHRQISLLSRESRSVMEKKGIKLEDGDFGENLMTEGIDLSKLTIGSLLRVNKDVLLRITQIGKECHDRCNIYYQVGDCIMPREGLFAEVLKGGTIRVDDTIEVLNDQGGNSHHK